MEERSSPRRRGPRAGAAQQLGRVRVRPARLSGEPGLTFYNPNLGLPTRERRPVERLLVGALSNILVFLGEEREWMRVDREGENEPR